MLKPYNTLIKRSMGEFIVNKSRFIGHGSPAQTEDEALGFLKEMRSTYKDASHNCYAYIIGTNMGIMRYSDDGEPGGTAGLPIIEVLKARQITNCCVVVTRYFGGVLLGAGGLTRAYAQGAATAVNACGVGVVHQTARYIAEVAYPLLARVEHMLLSQPVIVEDKAFSDVIVMTILVKCQDEDAFTRTLIEKTDGSVEPIRMEEVYMAWTEQ